MAETAVAWLGSPHPWVGAPSRRPRGRGYRPVAPVSVCRRGDFRPGVLRLRRRRAPGHGDEPVEPVLEQLRLLGLGAGEALFVLVRRQELERRVRLRADHLERALARDARRLVERARSATAPKPAAARSARRRRLVREAGDVDARAPTGSSRASQFCRELVGILGRDREPAGRRRGSARSRRTLAGGRTGGRPCASRPRRTSRA